MKKTVISVVIPIYKVEKYLRRCLDSVLSQTFSNWEMILVDDGSPDQCGAICDEYAEKDERIHVIHKKNQGVSAARNVGLGQCRGTYLFFLDPDDYIDSDAFRTMYAVMQEKAADIVMAGHNRVEADGSVHCDSEDWERLPHTKDIQIAILRNKLPNFVWGKLYKRELWDGVRFPMGQTMEDLYVCPVVFFKAKHIVVDGEPLYFYSHENVGSIMSVGGDQYIRLRYSRFLAWREHEYMAALYCPAYEEECAVKAVHAAVRAVALNTGRAVLNRQEQAAAEEYIRAHKQIPASFSITWTRSLILHQYQFILSLVGMVQRNLVNFQQQRRSQKKEYRK